MARVVQVGVGSGGMAVLDLVGRDARVGHVTLIDPDSYQPHNVHRHYFPPSAVGRLKVDLARDWLAERRPDLEIETHAVDLTAPEFQPTLEAAIRACDVGICAVDRESAKFHWNGLFLRHGKPWTLGEVLSGGIGGWVHRFHPGGACYGCVASALQRQFTAETAPPPDYAHPGGPIHETSIPADIASVHSIAAWHALATLAMLDGSDESGSVLVSLRRVAGLFDAPFLARPMTVPRAADCLICGASQAESLGGEDLDAALAGALAKLSDT